MQKRCCQCGHHLDLGLFKRRTASPDGLTAACSPCINHDRRKLYATDEAHRRTAIDRARRVKQQRFADDPAYKRAFNLWNSAKRRTTIPACMHIVDFLPVCRKAVKAGPKYVLDHIVPLAHPLICGLHVPWNLRVVKHRTNARKASTWAPTI